MKINIVAGLSSKLYVFVDAVKNTQTLGAGQDSDGPLLPGRDTGYILMQLLQLRTPIYLTNSRAFRLSRTIMSAASATAQQFDVLVIGGGSGGLAFAKRAAGYGASVCIVENKQFGGTCVNVGCVPKKIMYAAAHTREAIHEAHNFGSEAFACNCDCFVFYALPSDFPLEKFPSTGTRSSG